MLFRVVDHLWLLLIGKDKDKYIQIKYKIDRSNEMENVN